MAEDAGPEHVERGARDRDDDTTIPSTIRIGPSIRIRRRTAFLKSFDRSPGTPAEFHRPAARVSGAARSISSLSCSCVVVDERHAAALFSPICDCTISAYVGAALA